jgi:short-subunit dehydrogenase
MTFANHVVLITGASAGIGKALALALAQQKARLVLAARGAERLEAVASECRALGAEAHAVPTDVASQQACRALVEQAVARFDKLDVLINNAGRAMWSRFDEVADLSVIEEVLRLNYLGCVYATYYALPHLKKSRGRLVAMASIAGLTGVPMLSGYVASKHAVIGLFETLRIELDPFGVSTTIVAPDWVQSEILDRSLDPQGNSLGYSPMNQQRLMTAERCAELALRGIAKRKRLVLMSDRSKNLRWGKLLVPKLVDRMVQAAIRRGH